MHSFPTAFLANGLFWHKRCVCPLVLGHSAINVCRLVLVLQMDVQKFDIPSEFYGPMKSAPILAMGIFWPCRIDWHIVSEVRHYGERELIPEGLSEGGLC